jgi:hypothetical protein
MLDARYFYINISPMYFLNCTFSLLPGKIIFDRSSVICTVVLLGVILTSFYKDGYVAFSQSDANSSKEASIATSEIDPLIKALSSSSPEKKREAFTSLGNMAWKGVPALSAMLEAFDYAIKTSDFNTADAAITPLAVIGAYRIELLIEYAKNDDFKNKLYIISLFEQIGDHRLCPTILGYLNHFKSIDLQNYYIILGAFDFLPDSRVYESAIEALKKIGRAHV